MTSHSILAPSSAHRWIVCTPSARLEEGLHSSSVYAEEGTLAHSMSEAILKSTKGKLTKKEDEKFKANKLYTDEMPHEVNKYVEYVNSLTTPTAQRFIEAKLDMGFLSLEQKGTADTVIIDNNVLTIIDLKYGKGVRVDAKDNPQQMLYAAAAVQMFSMLYDIEMVKLCICQPRLDHISEWEISEEQLRKWIATTAIPAAIKAYAGEGDTTPGEHCKFCKVKGKCRALAEYNMTLEQHNFKEAPLLTNNEVADILKRIPSLKDWAISVEDYAREQLLINKSIPGFKLVEGRSKRIIVDPKGLTIALDAAGYGQDKTYTYELLGLTSLEKLVGKKEFSVISKDFIERVPGAPTMVAEDDARSEYVESIFKPIDC